MPSFSRSFERRPPDAQTTGLLSAVTVLRLVALAWAAVVVVIDINGSTEVRGALALSVLGALAVWTVALGWALVRDPAMVGRVGVVIADVAIGATVAGLDHVVYSGAHPQTFASVWPMSAAVVAGLLRGVPAGAAAGLVIGCSGAVGTALALDDGLQGRWTATVGTMVLLVVAGSLAGLVTDVLRRAEAAEARARAREEFARGLHDGVLQTLAVVQRRSDDPELVALAREQELDLREFIGDGRVAVPLLGAGEPHRPRTGADLAAALRSGAARAERRSGVRCELVVIDLPDSLSPPVLDALDGAVTEAVTNATKHGGASRVVVCLDVIDGELTCTVNDDGSGFDTSAIAEGTGLRRSVRGRIEEIGGSVLVDSVPGRGCEISLRVPLDA